MPCRCCEALAADAQGFVPRHPALHRTETRCAGCECLALVPHRADEDARSLRGIDGVHAVSQAVTWSAEEWVGRSR